jgi:hypothetical protein
MLGRPGAGMAAAWINLSGLSGSNCPTPWGKLTHPPWGKLTHPCFEGAPSSLPDRPASRGLPDQENSGEIAVPRQSSHGHSRPDRDFSKTAQVLARDVQQDFSSSESPTHEEVRDTWLHAAVFVHAVRIRRPVADLQRLRPIKSCRFIRASVTA